MSKLPRVAFTIADANNAWMVPMFTNSLRKFHSEEELPLIVYGEEELSKIQDPHKFYRATPMFAKDLLEKYELVIKFDVDQLIMGSLDYILNSEYEVGTVYNWNREDPLVYGEIGLLTIHPQLYYNCGLVAMRSERFVNNWWNLCNSEHFFNMPFREQGLLNILCHYGDYKVRCFDNYDRIEGSYAWFGLRNKGEGMNMILRDGKVILPKNNQNYPERDTEVKVWHCAGGADSPKMRYRTAFPEEIIHYIDWLVSDSKEEYARP